MADTAQDLIEDAVALGYDSLSHRDLLEALLYAVQLGGGGGSGSVTQGDGAPVAPPADPASAAIYTDRDPGSPTFGVIYTWDVDTQAWI